MLRPLILAASALALAACSTAARDDAAQSASAAPAQDCFRNDDIFGYGMVDDHTIEVRARGRYYVFGTNWNVRDLDWSQQIAIRSATSWICTGNGVGVEIIGGSPERRYPITSITRKAEEPDPVGS